MRRIPDARRGGGVLRRLAASTIATTAILILVTAVMLLVSCGAAGRGEAGYQGDPAEAKKLDSSRSGAAVADLAMEASPARSAPAAEPTEAEPGDGSPPGHDQQTGRERKLISTGSMDLVVDELETAETTIRNSVQEMGGYIASANSWSDGFSMTVKVPAEDFQNFIELSSTLGEVRSRNIDVQDVTDRFYDLEHRIRNKEILVERLRGYLERAEEIEEILRVERELNDTVTELERLKGSYRDLSKLIAFSTLHIQVQLPSYASDQGPWPSLRDGLTEFGYVVVRIFYTLLFVLLSIIVFGVPLALLTGLLYWLGFGRIGLLRRFFRRLRPGGSRGATGAGGATAPAAGKDSGADAPSTGRTD